MGLDLVKKAINLESDKSVKFMYASSYRVNLGVKINWS